MAQVKDLQAGTSGDTIPVAAGGTGSTTATSARTALSAAASGANSDITSLSGLTTALSVAQGGTGSTTATGSGAVVLTSSPSIASPTLTGTPVAPTAASGTNTTQVATTAFVQTATPYATSTTKGMVRVSVSGTTLNIYTTA